MPRAIVVATVALFLSTFSGADCVTKWWTPNVDFEDPINWDAGHVPTSVDVAVFQEDTAVPAVLPSVGVGVCEMVLPANGQLVLEPNAQITISASSKTSGGCTGQDVKFKQNSPLEWIDPENWSSKTTTSATPHVEKIPCVHDTVTFNPGHSFSITVPDIPISVGAVNFGNQTFGQNELNQFLISDIGDQELKSTSPDNDVSITLMSPSCTDSTGCECGTLQLLDQVCKTAYKRCHNKLGCISPVKPMGHCCSICGAYYLINYDNSFIYRELNKYFEKDMAKIKSTYEKFQLSIHMSKLSVGKIHIVIVSDTKYVDEINEIAKVVYSILTSYTTRHIGVTDVVMFSSGLSYDIDGMTYGQIALTTCTIVVSCMIAVIIYYTKNWKSLIFGSRSSAGAVFVKFENETNDVELINDNVNLQRKSSFDNPTYSAVENLSQSQTFAEVLSYADQLVSTTMPSDAMDVELKETNK